MAGSKKKVQQTQHPLGRHFGQNENPERYYQQHPAWNFSSCDKEFWSLSESDTAREIFWDEILPHFQALETQTWADILITGKKHNHSINVKNLNKIAADRLIALYIEAESLISLGLSATHRIYGYMNGPVFNILWVDLNHGDNAQCVCRSYKKHT